MEIVLILVILAFFVGYYIFLSFREAKIKKAEKAVKSGDFDTALSIFMENLKKNPDDVETLWHLGNINEEKQLYPEAIGYYTRLIELGKESKFYSKFELYKRVGILYRKIKRDQDALDYLMEAYNLLPSSREVLYNIASIVFSQKYFYRALPFFEKAIDGYKNNPAFLMDYGFCCMMVDKFEEALALFEEANKIDPSDYRKKMLLAYTYLRLGYYSKARELIEDTVNKYKDVMDVKELFYGIKLLYLIYLNNKNYDIVKDLITQLENINNNIPENPYKDDISMAYLFFRIKQEYYDLALETLNKSIVVKLPQGEELTEEDEEARKKSQSYMYELVSTLARYKREKELQLYTEKKTLKEEMEISNLETKAMEYKNELDKIYEDWKWKFVNKEELWNFFGPKVENRFDPTLIMEKYTESKLSSLKEKIKKNYVRKEEEKKEVVETEDICDKIFGMDIPSFLTLSRDLADKMGFKIISQSVKTDPIASAEGKGVDFLCVERYDQSVRVLFCVRRWKEEMGYLSLMNMVEAMKPLQASRLVIVSTSSLSTEASHAVENDKRITFYQCEDVVQYLE